MKGLFFSIIIFFMTSSLYAMQSFYCPSGSAYIRIGMTMQEVEKACGPPTRKDQTNNPVTTRVPVKQMIYTTLNKGPFYPTMDSMYTMWSLPSGSTGLTMQVTIQHGKVSSVELNQGSQNASTICKNGSVHVGDTEQDVVDSCGMPDMVNNTFVKEPVPSQNAPKIWLYQFDNYQPILKLTFAQGKLQSIEQ